MRGSLSNFWGYEEESELLLIALKFGPAVKAMAELPDVSKARIHFCTFSGADDSQPCSGRTLAQKSLVLSELF